MTQGAIKGRTYTIGRSRGADIILTHPTVSRAHAELTAMEDGSFFLIDCDSKFGTQVEQEGAWEAIRQTYIVDRQAVRFGEYVTSLRELLKRLPDPDSGERAIIEGPVSDRRFHRQTMVVSDEQRQQLREDLDRDGHGDGGGDAERDPARPRR